MGSTLPIALERDEGTLIYKLTGVKIFLEDIRGHSHILITP